MPKYRKKPEEVEVLHVKAGISISQIQIFVNNRYFTIGDGQYLSSSDGDIQIDIGDYLVKDKNGDIKAVKPNDFESMYETVDHEYLIFLVGSKFGFTYEESRILLDNPQTKAILLNHIDMKNEELVSKSDNFETFSKLYNTNLDIEMNDGLIQ